MGSKSGGAGGSVGLSADVDTGSGAVHQGALDGNSVVPFFQYSAKSADSLLHDGLSLESKAWNQLWCLKVPLKVEAYLWRVCKGFVPVRSELFRRHMVEDRDCWQLTMVASDVERVALEAVSTTDFMLRMIEKLDGEKLVEFAMVVWHLWKDRNNKSLGLPLVQPYIAGERGGRRFSEGVNFAVAGATAIAVQYYEEMGIHPATNASLGVQFDWFKHLLADIPDDRIFLQKSLVLMGEVGGNDYDYAILVHSLVPPVIDYVGSKIEVLIKLGVKTMIVPGNLPMGCLPIYLTQFKPTTSAKDYDPQTGCLSWLNELAMFHDELLLKELDRIRELYPHVTIIFGDYYNPTINFYRSPNKFGFTEGIHRACCGAGGPYNFVGTTPCGIPPATSCDDPSKFVSWDGIHLTEAAYRLISQGLIHQITTICPNYMSEPTRVYEY
ncbi:hypothetical protein ACS0TY_032232 [Phlomoides rotata]